MLAGTSVDLPSSLHSIWALRCTILELPDAMSRIYTSPLCSGVLGATNDITKFVQVSRVAQDLYEEAGLGGSADIFRLGLQHSGPQNIHM